MEETDNVRPIRLRTSAEIMDEMRTAMGPYSWTLAAELEHEYMAAQDRERAAEVEAIRRGGWFGKMIGR